MAKNHFKESPIKHLAEPSKQIKKKAGLKKSLGLFEMSVYGTGVILGAGIYALIGRTAGLSGNATWLAFVIGAIIAIFTGLSYAELSSLWPKAGGEYIYTEKAFGNRAAFIVGWLLLFAGAVAAATVALGFAGYFEAVFGIPLVVTAVILIGLLSIVNFWGIKQSAWINILFTAIESGGLLLIIFLGTNFFGRVDYFELPPAGFQGIIAAAALIFFAFIGFDQIVNLAEETRNAKKIVPQALIIAIIFTTIIYILVAISAVSLLDWQILATSNAPLAEAAAVAFGPQAFNLLAIVALFATSNTVMILMIATSRILYGMSSNESYLPRWMSKISTKTRTPWVSILIVMFLTMAFATLKEISVVASLTNVSIFSVFIVINLVLIWLRFKKPNLKRPFKSPINIGKVPVLGVLGVITCVWMLTQFELNLLLGGLAIILSGLGAYEILELYNKKWRQKPRQKRK